MTIKVPRPVYKALKRRAIDEDTDMTAMVNRWFAEKLARAAAARG